MKITEIITETVNVNFADGKVNFTMPNFDFEWDEAQRYPEFRKIGKEAWIKLASKGKAVTITDASDINNTDAADPDSFKTLDPAKQKRALAQVKSGKVELPIMAVYSDGHKELVGGNTRLTAMMAKHGKGIVWQFEVPDEIADVDVATEGNKAQLGIPANATDAELRKARKAGGKKGKRAHWLLNMRKGNKKK